MFIKYFSFWCLKHTSSSQRQYPTVIEELCYPFSLTDLRKSTNNFDEKQIIGTSGLGTVHKGSLQHNGITEHTVSVYKIHGSTDKALNDVKMKPLTWKQRLKICIGTAHGLHYLHAGTKRTIFHRDVTPYNILLDSNMVAKLADFRLSLTGPLYALKPKPKTISKDGFKVLLEVVCKDKLKDIENRQKHAVEENIDPNLKGKIAPECWEVFMDITERCLKFDSNERPAMDEVEVQVELALSGRSRYQKY
ncbi:hypothetical protein VNO78_14920 [Psophocarpus tetragonolobus]|uniref:Protein kinase domain-containing protein n=1 Tax=Psophocarpus tetragonolobus TaxID=3891 RepID=A0AAN9XJF4_PSOTE